MFASYLFLTLYICLYIYVVGTHTSSWFHPSTAYNFQCTKSIMSCVNSKYTLGIQMDPKNANQKKKIDKQTPPPPLQCHLYMPNLA